MIKKAAGAPQGFREFARRFGAHDAISLAFKPYAMRDDFPDKSDWGAIRRYLVHNGAEHEAFVGARTVWRAYIQK